jgi:hypothetical protein
MTYTVWIDDNFHYMEDDESYKHGEFETLEAAVAVCKKIVDDYLMSAHTPGMTAAALFESYTSFGEDPSISGAEGVPFSGWTYAKQRYDEICAAAG